MFIWAGEGKSRDTLTAFFDELGPERRTSIELVSIDMSAAFIKAIEEVLPNASIVFDHFHVGRLASDAVTEVRRAQMRQLASDEHSSIKGTRWALLKNPENLHASEKAKLELARKTNKALYRAHLLKETFLDIFTIGAAITRAVPSTPGSPGRNGLASLPSFASLEPCADTSTASSPSSSRA